MKNLKIKFVFILILAVSIGCEKDKELTETDSTNTNPTTTDTDNKDDDNTNNNTTTVDSIVWTVEQSVIGGSDTAAMKGTLILYEDSTFTYEEEITKQTGATSIDILDPIEGTYIYSGTPNVDGNIVFTYTDNGQTKISNSKFIIFGDETIQLNIDKTTRFLSNTSETLLDPDNATTSLEGTTWISNSYLSYTFGTTNHHTFEFYANGECDLTTHRDLSTDFTEIGDYTFEGTAVEIIYYNYTTTYNDTATGIVAGNTMEIDMYGETLLLEKQ